MVVGQGGLAAFTGNGGGSWNVRTDMAPSGQELYDCLCVEPTREFYVYGNFADTHLMEVSTEGTTSSSIERTGEGSSLRKYLTMDTFDGVNMMASGADQSSAIMPLKYSINGGVTWQFVLSQGYTNKSVNGIFMDTNSTGILVGNNGFVAYTNLSTASQINLTDPVLSQNHNNFYAIYGLRDGSQAWAVGQGGIIYHYTNIGGTKTWTKQAAPSNDPTDLYAVFFIDASNGWIAGNSGHVYKYAP